jgi:regulatory protein YycI of two-component signal transduction system YycFG
MEFRLLAAYDNYVLANMALGLLQENNIECHLKDEHIVTLDPLLNPAVGGIKLMVAANQFEKAVSIIKETENEYLKDFTCPHCNTNSLIVEEKKETPTTFWGTVKNKILYGQSTLYSKKYRCQNCKSLLNELPISQEN